MIRVYKGFSLVELLIAMSILLMVTFIGTYGYGLYSRYWERELGDFTSKFEEVKGVSTLFSTLNHIKPYVIKDIDGNPYHYFEGGRSVIRSVIDHGLSDPDFPAMFEIKVEDAADGKRLVYREKPMTNKPFYTEAELDNYSFEIELLSGFSDIAFEFFGWPDFDTWIENEQGEGKYLAQWYGYYSGKDTLITPNLIRVTISDSNDNSTLELQLADFSETQLKAYFTGDT